MDISNYSGNKHSNKSKYAHRYIDTFLDSQGSFPSFQILGEN